MSSNYENENKYVKHISEEDTLKHLGNIFPELDEYDCISDFNDGEAGDLFIHDIMGM